MALAYIPHWKRTNDGSEVSLFPTLIGCKVSMEMTVEGYQMKMQFKNMCKKQPVNA
ncbi:hypothetical protein QUF81_01770 [Peribacillus simplex]|uniref:Uncharacterized protein n=1 Tax=Peribacillus simplex TaxID=1478 RepID=A0AAW7IA75_9BACI|nr:hypothetical protein [Peribacillus simplex]MDM5292001.1 hypothetical protein [Peribacillus simplex]MDM5450840.1 hypothetical protein [Peribacillus simplex]